MSYLTETATLEYETSGSNGNYEYHLPHTKTIDLIGEEFAPKRSQNQQQPSVIVETIDSAETNGSSIVTPISTMSSQHLGPNVVYVNSTGGSGVPLQIQQIIQQAQQQVRFDKYWVYRYTRWVRTLDQTNKYLLLKMREPDNAACFFNLLGRLGRWVILAILGCYLSYQYNCNLKVEKFNTIKARN